MRFLVLLSPKSIKYLTFNILIQWSEAATIQDLLFQTDERFCGLSNHPIFFQAIGRFTLDLKFLRVIFIIHFIFFRSIPSKLTYLFIVYHYLDGHISIFRNEILFTTAFDRNSPKIQYIALVSDQQSRLDFFYDCNRSFNNKNVMSTTMEEVSSNNREKSISIAHRNNCPRVFYVIFIFTSYSLCKRLSMLLA